MNELEQDDQPVDEFDELYANGEHIWHHNQPPEPHVSVKCEKNSKGFNWEVSVSGCETVDEAMAMLDEARAKMEQKFGGVQVAV